MKVRDFLFWLHGNFEISGSAGLDRTQLTVIRRHLAKVKVYHDSQDAVAFVCDLSKLVDLALRELAPSEKLSAEQCRAISDRLDALFVPEVEVAPETDTPWVGVSNFAWIPPPKVSFVQKLADAVHRFFSPRPHYDEVWDQPLC